MVLIYLHSGECIEVEDAVRAEARGGNLVCLGKDGMSVAEFLASDVETFTANEEMADAIKEEVCEDLTVIGAQDKKLVN